MKRFLQFSLVGVILSSSLACVSKNNGSADSASNGSDLTASGSESEIKSSKTVPSFPYQKYLDSIGEDEAFPYIGDDGNGFNAISHKIRYPEMPGNLRQSLFADSLLQLYNTVLAYNTVAYDISTGERYLEEEKRVKQVAAALDAVNLSGIDNVEIKNAIADLSKVSADLLRHGQYPNGQNSFPEVDRFYSAYNNIYDTFLDTHLAAGEYEPSAVLDNYAEIHEKALSRSPNVRDELLQMVLQENNFERKCILAREFAISNFDSSLYDNIEEFISVLDEILRSDEYSPMKHELWLMWRTGLQLYLFGGRSNDSAMYNLFYNDMRNLVALNFISHLKENPHDSVAFLNFFRLVKEPNIVRNSSFFLGNNANINQMELYYEKLNKEEE